MDGRRVLAALLVVVVLLAGGCNGLLGDGDNRTRVGEVSTDAPPPSETVRRLGIDRGVTNTSGLARAHDAALANQSYTVTVNRTMRTEEDALHYEKHQTTRVAAGGEPVSAVVEQGGSRLRSRTEGAPPVHIEYWAADGRLLRQATYANGTTGRTDLSGGGQVSATYLTQPNGRYIASAFNATETHTTGTVTRDGRTLYRIEAERLAVRRGPRNVTFRALVDERGFVHEYRLAYTATWDDTTVRVVEAVNYSRVGTTTVERPAWVESDGTERRLPVGTHGPAGVGR